MLKMLLNFLITYFSRPSRNAQPSVPEQVQKPAESQPRKEEKPVQIDWTNPEQKISKYFSVKEALYLPSWKVLHIPNEQEKANILKTAEVMDKIREFLGKPISVHVWLRPTLNNPSHAKHGQDYNLFIKGAKASAHKVGLAVDWSCRDYTCDKVRELLLPKLEEFNIRVEDLPGSNWVHTGTDWKPGKSRFFKP